MKFYPTKIIKLIPTTLVFFLFFSCATDSDLLADYVIEEAIVNETTIDANDASIVVDEDKAVSFNMLNNAANKGSNKRYKSSKQPMNGGLVIQKDSIAIYTPDYDFNGKDTIEITLEVTNEDNSTSDVPLIVDVNVKPTVDVVDDKVETEKGSSLLIEPLKNDKFRPESGVVVSETTTPSKGTVVLNDDSTVTYTPNTGAVGIDLFSYTTKIINLDESETTEKGSITVTINGSGSSQTNPGPMGPLKAFPGAEGFGKNATGGRGGNIIHVTNLNDSGPGSFRDALGKTGNRTIVFDVGGTINAQNYFDIPNGKGNVTIAGQTAPGGGIMIKGGELRISASNVIVRYLRFRLGSSTFGADSNEDGINITAYRGDKIENIIIDHCSISWAQDENISLVGGFSGSSVSNVSIQNCIIAESGYGLLSYKNNRNISIIKNLFANNRERNIRANWPISGAFQFELTNNLIYGYRAGTNPSLGMKFTVLNNKYKKSASVGFGGSTSINGELDGTGIVGDTYAYISGNIAGSGQSEYSSNLNSYKKTSPFESSGYSALSANSLEDALLNHVGASLPIRDAVDTRIISNYNSGTGSLVSTGTFPNISNGSGYLDNDKDGMSDSWEISNGLNPNDSSDGNGDRDNDGFTNLEEFLHAITFI
jgi:hypothetical protein